MTIFSPEAGIVSGIILQCYLASDFIKKMELPAELAKVKPEGTLVLNINARRSIFHEIPIGYNRAKALIRPHYT
ncbi:hypothetical protein M2273_005909 [Mucilaginibacter lappiensis]